MHVFLIVLAFIALIIVMALTSWTRSANGPFGKRKGGGA
jgi:hypothetical protein